MRFFLEKRVNTSPWGRAIVLAAAMMLVLFISLFFFLAVGIEPFAAYNTIGEEVFIPANAIHTVRNIGKTNNVWYFGYKNR